MRLVVGLCPDPQGELIALPKPLAGLGGRGEGNGKGEGEGGVREREEGREEGKGRTP